MPYVPNSAIVQFFTGALSTSSPFLGNADKVAIADYSGHLAGATDLGQALAMIDGLTASGQGTFLGFSMDGTTWHADPVAGDTYIRFASGQTRPPDADLSWSVGIMFVGPSGIQGAFYIRQYQNSVLAPTAPTGASFDVTSGVLTPSTGWTVDVTTPGVGENTWFVQWLFDPAIHTGTIVPTWSAVIEAGGTGPPGTPGITLAELFVGLVSGDGITFDDTVPDQRTIAVGPTIARLDSPILTGMPQAPTLTLGADDLGIASTEWVQREISGLVDTVALAGATLTVSDRDGISRTYTLPSGGGGMAGGTGDLNIEELLNQQTTLTLPANHVWVNTNLALADSIQVLLVDASDATDDYEVVDWEGVKALPAGVAGQVAAAATYHTFQAAIQDVVYEVRIGHTATNEVLLAANHVAALGLPELRIDRLLAPIELITGIDTDTAFLGDGATATPLMLNVGGADFPIIPISKGGTGATTSGLARTNLGLGTASRLDIGTAAGEIPMLGTGGVLPTSALAPGGIHPQVLTRTTTGQEWADLPVLVDTNEYVNAATLALNPSNQLVLTLGRTGTLADVVSSVLTLPPSGLTSVASDTAFGGDGTTGNPLTLDATGADFPVLPLAKGGTGAVDAPAARVALGLGTAALADTGAAAGNVPVLGATGFISALLLGSGADPGRRLAYGSGGFAEWVIDSGGNRIWQASSVTYAPTTLTITVSGVVIETGMIVLFEAPAGTYSGINVVQVDVNSTGVQDLISRDGNQIPSEEIVAGRLYAAISTNTNYQLVADHLTEVSVNDVSVAMTTRELTVTVRDSLGRMFTDTQTFNLSAGSIASGEFGSGRIGTTPLAGEFLVTDGANSTWRDLVPSDLHGGAVGQFVRSDGAMGAWANFVPDDFVAGAANGDILGITAGALAWLAPTGVIGVESIIPGAGLNVDQGTGDVTISIESQYLGRQLGTAATPTFSLSAGNYLVTLGIADVPVVQYNVGDTFTFYVPDPINQAGNDASPLTFLPGTTGSHFQVVSLVGGAQLTRADLVPGALHTIRYNQLARFALVEPSAIPAPDTNDYVQTATFATVGSAITLLLGRTGGLGDVVSNSFTLPADTNNYVDSLALAVVGSDLTVTLGRLGLGDLVEMVTLPAGLTDTNEYVDTAVLSLSGSDLTLTLGRTGSLADVVSNVLTLPAGGGVNVSAWNDTDTFEIGDIVTRNGRAYIARLQSTNADPDLETSAANWFLIRTGEEIIHTPGRFYAPGTVVNLTGGSPDVFIARRPTTDTPSMQDADWFHLPRGAVIVEATTAAGTYRSGTVVTVGPEAYYCHTSVPLPGVTAALIPANANFTRMTGTGLTQVFRTTALTGLGTPSDLLDLNVGGTAFPVIPIVKGGTGATDVASARTNLGLGTAALADTGVALGEIPLLGTDGLLDAGRFAPAGTVGQALLRTATGQEWGDVAGVTGGLQFAQLGHYQFGSAIDSTQDNAMFDAGFSAPPNSNAVFRLIMGDDNGRVGTALIRGSDVASLVAVAAPVWVDDTTTGVQELNTNSRMFPYGSNRGLFLGITTGGNLAVGSTHDGIRPYVTLEEVVGGGGGGGTGTQHYYPIPDTGVGGTGDAVTLTTGESITGYTNGLQVYFNANEANTGAITLAVDGLPARPLRGSNGRGSATDLPPRAITGNDPVLAVYDAEFDEFYFIPGHQGTAAQRNVGLFEFDLPALGTGGVLPVSTLAPTGVVGQALLRTATGQEWGDVAAGGLAGITGETEFIFAGVWANLQVRATNIQVPADARYIAAVMQMAGSHSSSSDDPYSSVQVFDADRFRAFSAIAEGDNPRDNNGNFFGVDFGGSPNDLLVAKVTSGSDEVIGIAATTQIQARVRSMRVRFITDLAGGGGGNDYVEAATLALSGQDLTLTLARTGSLVDVVSAVLALPFGPGTITGVMTGAGLIGGGIAGVVTIGIDPSQAGFPVIPLDKGGTGATDAAGARTALGLGSAATRTAGDAAGNLAVLQPNGSFLAQHISPGGADTQVLTRDGSVAGMTWADVPITGDITAVLTAAGSGLSGGTAAGSANLAIDIVGLPALSSTELADSDEFLVGDVSDAANPRKRISFGSMMSFAADDVSIESGSGQLRVKDSGIRATMLDTNNTPTAGQIFSFDGLNDFTWINLPPGLGNDYVDTALFQMVSGELRLTLGRTGGLGDVLASIALPRGDITSVGAGNGLSGGGVIGDVTLDLDFDGLPLVSEIVATDNFAFADTSDGGNVRRVTWGGAIARIADQDTLVTSNGVIRIADGGVRTVHIGAAAVHTDELAPDAVTEPKLAISGTPTTGQVIGWDGLGLEWTTAGVIVNNFVNAATLSLNASDELVLTLGRDGLGDVVSNVLTLPIAGVYGDADVDARLIDRLQNAQQSGVSFDDRLLLWDSAAPFGLRSTRIGDARGYMVAPFAQPTSSTTLPPDKVANNSIDEAKLAISNDPASTDVMGWDGAQMVWRPEGGTPVLTHTRYFAVGADRTFVEADYIGGLAFMSDTFTVPTFTANRYWAIAVPASNPITSIIALTTPQQDLTSQFTQESDLVIDGENHNIWISQDVYYPISSGTMLRIT